MFKLGTQLGVTVDASTRSRFDSWERTRRQSWMPGSSLTLGRRDPIGQRFESFLPKHCHISHKHELIYTTYIFTKMIWINISTQQLGIYNPSTYSALFPWCPICVLLYSKSRVSPRLILRDQARQIVFPMG